MAETTVENPDASMRYGAKTVNVADIFEPEETTDSLVLLFHGGFWTETDRIRTWAAGHALAEAGHLTATVGYTAGPGAWQSALDDVVTAIDEIQLSGREWTIHNEAPRKITLVGHSAGGQLALWAANRAGLPEGNRWRTDDLQATGVVAVAPIADLAKAADLGIGDGAVARFLGGTPTEVPEAYRIADPAAGQPSIPVHLLHGAGDDQVPLAVSESYLEKAADSGQCRLDILDGVGHADWAEPGTLAWTKLIAAVEEMAR